LLQRHAQQLAQRHRVAPRKSPNRLLPRLANNERILCDYNEQTLLAEKKRRITPAAEWLLDNFYLIEEQIRMARHHLPRGFSRELPHLTHGPSAELPRVYDLAQELVSHVDGRIDAAHLTAFIAAYQEITPLKLGELWAVPIMLRLALLENLRRIAVLLTASRKERDHANYWADRILEVAEVQPSHLIVEVGDLARSGPRLTPAFVTEFWRRMQEKSSHVKLVLGWIEECLVAEGVTVELMIQSESQKQAADQVSVGNSITSFRFLDVM
jgi:cyclic beta-1,2-glucan synthetase